MKCAFCGVALLRFDQLVMVGHARYACADVDACRARREASERRAREAAGMDVPKLAAP